MTAPSYYARHRPIELPEAAQIRRRALAQGRNIVLTDPVQDEIWARQSIESQRPSDYFDYFFSGEDIKVRVAEIPEDDPKFGQIPIGSLEFMVQQEKQPVFGFWSFTYDAVMRGTRMVAGTFSIFTKYPDYMTELLALAASNRATKTDIDRYTYPKGLTEDDAKIDQYWSRHIDPTVDALGGKHIFAVHPPFSLVVTYGVQHLAVPSTMESNSYNNWYAEQYADRGNAILSDENHRLVESDPTYENRLIIDGIELQGCSRTFQPGLGVGEAYSFFARDVFVPKAKARPPLRLPVHRVGPAVPDF